MCASAGSRINTGFFVHLYIFLSQAVRARTEHAAGRAHWRADSNRDVSSLARGAALQACRLLAFRKAGKVPAKPPARTYMNGSIKRERQLAAPRREETAEALRRGRALSSRSSAAFSRRSLARLARGATPACRRCACKCPPAGSAPGGYPSEPPGPGPAPESGRRSSGW